MTRILPERAREREEREREKEKERERERERERKKERVCEWMENGVKNKYLCVVYM